MKDWKKLMRLAVGCVMVAGATRSGRADEKKTEPSLAHYLEQLQTRLEHTARRVNRPTSEGSSVVGLRGAQQESASKQLYWKGQKGKTTVTPEEVKAFRAAVEQARAGKNTDAIAALKTFQEKYPQSALGPDVHDALGRLSATSQPN